MFVNGVVDGSLFKYLGLDQDIARNKEVNIPLEALNLVLDYANDLVFKNKINVV